MSVQFTGVRLARVLMLVGVVRVSVGLRIQQREFFREPGVCVERWDNKIFTFLIYCTDYLFKTLFYNGVRMRVGVTLCFVLSGFVQR